MTPRTKSELETFEREVYAIYGDWCRNIRYGEASMVRIGEASMVRIGEAFQQLYGAELDEMLVNDGYVREE